MISGRTALHGVVGHPVGHSLSPATEGEAFAALGLDAVPVALSVPPGRLEAALEGAHALGFDGMKVPVPHEPPAAARRKLDATAEVCGAANTLRPLDEGWDGFNADAPALPQAAGPASGARALLLGAGGAAVAGAWALLGAGADLEVAARWPETTAALVARMRGALPGAGAVRPVPSEGAAARAEEAQAVVNATSIGLGGGMDDGPPPPRFRRGQIAGDLVHGDSAFARAAAALVPGEQILLRQGAVALTLWTGRPAAEAAVAEALGQARSAQRGKIGKT